MIETWEIWGMILGLGLGSFLLRFSFTGLIGSRALPPWVLRHLRYTAVAILPGLVAPLVLWPAATGGNMDAPRLIAAAVTLLTGVLTRSILAAIATGAGALYLAMFLL